MKTACLVAERTIEIRDVPDPVCPDDGLILAVKACGICGSDIRRWKEGPPQGISSITPGHELSGIVVETGANVEKFAVGDRLAVAPDVHCGHCYYCRRGMYNLCDNLKFLGITPGYPGGFAEKMAISGQVLANGIVHRMPNSLAFSEGAFAEPCCSVLACHNRAGTTLGDTIVVMGAGPIGCLHIVVAKARGARVIVSEPVRLRREMAEKFAPDFVIDPSNQDLSTLVKNATAGTGADIVICANPVAGTQTQAVEIVRKGGKVILFGGLPKANPMTTLDGNRIHYNEIEVIGSFSYHPTVHELALRLLANKIIPAERFITHTFKLDETGKAFETAGERQALKVIIELD